MSSWIFLTCANFLSDVHFFIVFKGSLFLWRMERLTALLLLETSTDFYWGCISKVFSCNFLGYIYFFFFFCFVYHKYEQRFYVPRSIHICVYIQGEWEAAGKQYNFCFCPSCSEVGVVQNWHREFVPRSHFPDFEGPEDHAGRRQHGGGQSRS